MFVKKKYENNEFMGALTMNVQVTTYYYLYKSEGDKETENTHKEHQVNKEKI